MAASKGDVAEAEALYHEAIALNPDAPTARFDLAELLDRAGRTREAYAQYGIALRGNPRSWSSQQEDSRILARYGDMATRFGDANEAALAYAKAARDGDPDGLWAPRTGPRGTSLASLRAAAHAAAAVRLRNVLRNEEAEREMRIAAAADPSYWVPHFRLAQWLGAERRAERRAEAVREAALAQKLAPSAKHRAMVMRLDAGKRP